MTAFARRLRRLRRAAHLSQRELAETCGIDRSTVCNLEASRHGVSLDTAALLAHVLGPDLVAPRNARPRRPHGGRRRRRLKVVAAQRRMAGTRAALGRR